jgi:large exoprotein involved in heme utilization and adhesion
MDEVRLQFNGAFVSSGIVSNVGSGANANAGNINITASSLSLTNGAQIQSAVESANIAILPIFPEPIELPAGQGKGGKVSIDVRDAVILDGESNGLISGIGTFLNQGATGIGGDIEIKAGSLSMINGGLLSTSTGGQGNAGNVIIDVDGGINFDGVSSEGFTSGILSQVELGGIGKGGNVSITGRSLSLSNGAQITTSVGRAFGDFPASQGEAGKITIDVLEAVNVDGVANTLDFFGQPTILPSGITSSLDVGTKGSAGTIDITAESLSLTNGGQLLTQSFGEGNAGKINIDIRGEVTIAGVDSSKTFNSGLFTALEWQGVGHS